nr:RNA-directed DNA polymerase, eukaryota [Tanacetum cinerariifolium]
WVPGFVKQDDKESNSDDKHSEGELNGDILRSNEDLEGDNEKDSKDPFNIYTLLNKKKENNEKILVTHDSLKYPFGFTPKEDVETNVEQSKKRNGSVREVSEEANRSDDIKSASKRIISKEEGTESVFLGHFKKSKTPRSGGSILSLMDELIKKGEVIVMGDFNEVRNKNERFGLVFNVQGANAFNSFISSAGLEEVPLGAPVDMWNAMLNLMKKLKYLKKKIRAWNNDMRKYSKNRKLTFKAELENLDSIIDKGEGNDDIINKRMAIVKSIQELDKL